MKFTDLPKELGGVFPHHLTERQEYVWLYMLNFQAAKGMPPTVRELRKVLGIASTHGAKEYFQVLIRKGFAEAGAPKAARAIVAVDPTYVPTEKGLEAAG